MHPDTAPPPAPGEASAHKYARSCNPFQTGHDVRYWHKHAQCADECPLLGGKAVLTNLDLCVHGLVHVSHQPAREDEQ